MSGNETEKSLRDASNSVARMIAGEGRGAVFVIFLDKNGKIGMNFAHVRMTPAEAIGMLEFGKQALIRDINKEV